MLNEIRTALDNLLAQDPNDWTHGVKSAICGACLQYNPHLKVYAAGVGEDFAHGGEWLYDVSAQQYDDDGYLIRSVLAAECEWGVENEIYHDFQKLLIARADLRVMVFDGARSPGYREIFQTLTRYVCRCSHTEAGDAWLLAAWTNDGFVHHRIKALRAQGDLD